MARALALLEEGGVTAAEKRVAIDLVLDWAARRAGLQLVPAFRGVELDPGARRSL